MKATLFLPGRAPESVPARGLHTERCEVGMGALCVAAGLLGVELPDVRSICIDPVAGIVAYVGNELQALADQRNVEAEVALNRLLPGAPFFGEAAGPLASGRSWYGPVLLVERGEGAKAFLQEG
jgi:hypothetical protein